MVSLDLSPVARMIYDMSRLLKHTLKGLFKPRVFTSRFSTLSRIPSDLNML